MSTSDCKIWLPEYAERIVRLPPHTPLTKRDLLVPEFKLYEDGRIEMYYAPHNEVVNEAARVLIVGITPGWTQTEAAFRQARRDLLAGLPLREVSLRAKRAGRFAGAMRSNLIAMLDYLGLQRPLVLDSCASLFADRDELLHTTSLTKYPVFVGGRNYTGHSPVLLKHEWLRDFSLSAMTGELRQLRRQTLVIPLGRAVEGMLHVLVKRGELRSEQCLFGFPHPSGANAHRHRQLREAEEQMRETIWNVCSDYAHTSGIYFFKRSPDLNYE